MEECVAARLGSGLPHGDCVEELGGAIEDAEEVFEPVALWQGAYHVDVEFLEPLVCHWELPYPRFDV